MRKLLFGSSSLLPASRTTSPNYGFTYSTNLQVDKKSITRARSGAARRRGIYPRDDHGFEDGQARRSGRHDKTYFATSIEPGSSRGSEAGDRPALFTSILQHMLWHDPNSPRGSR